MLGLGLAYLQKGEAAKAIPALSQIVRRNAEDAQARRGLALAYEATKEWGKAAQQWEQLLDMAPGDGEVRARMQTARQEAAEGQRGGD